MKTVLQELIDWCAENRTTEENQAGTIMTVVDFGELTKIATELIEKERQQITEAYNMGAGYEYKYQSSGCTIDVKTSEQYYTETFTELEIK